MTFAYKVCVHANHNYTFTDFTNQKHTLDIRYIYITQQDQFLEINKNILLHINEISSINDIQQANNVIYDPLMNSYIHILNIQCINYTNPITIMNCSVQLWSTAMQFMQRLILYKNEIDYQVSSLPQTVVIKNKKWFY